MVANVLRTLLLVWLALPLTAHDLEGIVYAPGGTPVAGARVVAGALATVTSRDGAFTLKNVPDGVVIAHVSAEGFAHTRRLVALAGDPSVTVILADSPTDDREMDARPVSGAGTIRGVVRLEGKPLAGVTVVVTTIHAPDAIRVSTISDAKGNFAVDRLPNGSYSVFAGEELAPRLREVERLVVDLMAPVAKVDLAMHPAPIVTGRVVDFEGKPVAGALVETDPIGWDRVCCTELAARTRPDGTFAVIAPLDATGSVVLMIGARNSAVIRTEPFTPTTRTRMEVRLPKFHVVTLRVTNQTGKPLAGARLSPASSTETSGLSISGLLAGEYPDRLLFANEAGEVVLRLTSDDYDFFASAREHQPRRVSRPIERSTSIAIALERAAAIRGRVVRNKEGVAGISASVAVGVEPETLDTTTDDAGRFEFEGLAPGPYSIELRADDKTVERTLAVEAPAELEIVVPATGRIRGRVTDASTDGVVSTFGVSAVPKSPDETQPADGVSEVVDTSSLGEFELTVPVGGYYVRANAPGFTVSRPVDVEVTEDGTVDVAIALERGLTIEGRVLDDDGVPVADASVWAHELDGGLIIGLSDTKTDASGEFVIRGLEAGWVRLGASHVEFLDDQNSVELTGDRNVDLHLSRGRTIRGLVTLGGRPVPGAEISASTSAGEGQSSTPPEITGDDGRFVLRGLARARYVLTAVKGDNQADTTIDATEQREITLAIDPTSTGTIQGFVTGMSASLGGRIFKREVHEDLLDAEIGDDGSYRIDDVPVGRVNVRVMLESSEGSRDSARQEIEVTPDRASVLDFDLTPAARVEGRVTRDGTPAVGAPVTFQSKDDATSSTTTQAGGRYALSLPSLGHFSVEVNGPGGVRTTHEFRGSETFDIELGSRVVEGIVFDAETGKPSPVAKVMLISAAGVLAETFTKANGHFRLEATTVGGAASLVASAEERVQQEQRVDLTSSTPKEIHFTLTRGAALRVRAVDAHGGAPLRAFISMDNRWASCATSNIEPACVFWVEPGKYKLTVTAEGYELNHTEVSAPGTIDIPLK